jgi:hypothetical protein
MLFSNPLNYSWELPFSRRADVNQRSLRKVEAGDYGRSANNSGP